MDSPSPTKMDMSPESALLRSAACRQVAVGFQLPGDHCMQDMHNFLHHYPELVLFVYYRLDAIQKDDAHTMTLRLSRFSEIPDWLSYVNDTITERIMAYF